LIFYDYFQKHKDQIDDSKRNFFEHALGRAVHELLANGGSWSAIPFPLIVEGISGTNNAKHNTIKNILKIKLRFFFKNYKNLRDLKLKISTIFNISSRVVNIAINLAFVPLLIKYLKFDLYGIWITIYSFANWLNMFDLGLGNGLKIKLTEAFTSRRHNYIRESISTAYTILGMISLSLIGLFIIFNSFFDVEVLLGLSEASNLDLSIAISILFIFISLILTIKNIGVIYSSLQLPHIDSVLATISQLFFFIYVFVLYYLKIKPSLSIIALGSAIPLLVSYLILSFFFFYYKAPNLKFTTKLYSKVISKEIMSPGIGFFIIQVSCLILYSTDNLIIANLLSAEEVTFYNVPYKYFGLPFMVFSVYISTHWPAFIDALAKKDYDWIKQKLRRFNYLFLLLIVIYFIMYFCYDFAISIWIHDKSFKINNILNISMIFYYLISSYATIYIYVINASGKILLQKYLYIIIAFINIPLSYFFIKYFNLGSAGVILASALCLILLLIFMPLQSKKILNNSLKGFWDK